MSCFQMVPLILLLALAAGIDLRARRIPNWLSFSIVLTGLVQSFMPGSLISPGWALLGCTVGLSLPLMLFVLGALGGGDVKLLTGVGAWLGPWGVLCVFAIQAVIGMGIVLVQAWASGRLGALVRNSAMLAMNVGHVQQLGVEHVKSTGQSCRSIEKPLPFAIPVLVSTVIVIWTMGLSR